MPATTPACTLAGDLMRPPELTVGDVETLACAATDPDNAPMEQLISRTVAAEVDDILVGIMVARGFERTLLLAIARQAIAQHAPLCRVAERPCRDKAVAGTE